MQRAPNHWLEVDLAGFCPRIWVIGISKLVLLPKGSASRSALVKWSVGHLLTKVIPSMHTINLLDGVLN